MQCRMHSKQQPLKKYVLNNKTPFYIPYKYYIPIIKYSQKTFISTAHQNIQRVSLYPCSFYTAFSTSATEPHQTKTSAHKNISPSLSLHISLNHVVTHKHSPKIFSKSVSQKIFHKKHRKSLQILLQIAQI